jgi:serine/threonine-protein kinase HipA
VGQRESAAFQYDAGWLEDPERFAIDPSLPLVGGFQFHARRGSGSLFHGAISDTEPDGWGRRVILRDHAKRRQRARDSGESVPSVDLRELDYLLAVDDESRLGALRFRDEEGHFREHFPEGARRTPPLLELGQLLRSTRAVELSEETAADLEYLRGRGTSLGGLRPKCSVRDDDGHLALAKFPSVSDERAVTKGEVLALRLAEAAGVTVASARVVQSDGVAVALIRRFDRTDDGERVPYVSAATMLGVERDDSEPHCYTDIVDAIRIHGHDARRDIEELFLRVAFSVAINNVDDHLHNHGFLHVGRGQWRLSPLFDVNPFPDRARELKTWTSRDNGPDASYEALLSVAPYFRLTVDRAREMIATVSAATARWRDIGADIGMTKSELDSFADAFRSLSVRPSA